MTVNGWMSRKQRRSSAATRAGRPIFSPPWVRSWAGAKTLSFARERDFPADRLRSDFHDELDVVHTRWELSDAERTELEAISGAAAASELIHVSRSYTGKAVVHLEGSEAPASPEDHAKGALRELEASLPEGARDDQSVVLALEALARRTSDSAADRRVWNEGLRSSLELLATSLEQGAIELDEHARAARDSLADLANQQDLSGDDAASAARWILDRLPCFIHVDDVPNIEGKMNLREYARRKQEGTAEVGDTQFGMLLKMAGVDDTVLEELMSAELEIRRQIVGQAGALVTRRIRAVWSDRPLKVRFYLDGDQLNTLVCEPTDFSDLEVNLNQRSRGFRWFFSFCVIVNGSQNEADERGIVLLLDEPGLHLHPVGQADLIQYLCGIEAPALLTTQARALLPSGPETSVLAVDYNLERGAKVADGPIDLGPDSPFIATPGETAPPAVEAEVAVPEVSIADAGADTTDAAEASDQTSEARETSTSESQPENENADEAPLTSVTVDAETGQLTSSATEEASSTDELSSTDDMGVVFEVEGQSSETDVATESSSEDQVSEPAVAAPIVTHQVVSLDEISAEILAGLVGDEPALLVENLSDFWYLRAASDYLVSQGRQGLPEGIAPLPVSKSLYLTVVAAASRAAGNNAVVVLGTRPWSAMETTFGDSAEAMKAGYIYAGTAHEEDMPERCDIEDLVDSRVYERFVSVTYGKDLPDAEFVFDAEQRSMITRCEQALQPFDLTFIRTRPAKLVANGSERNVRAFLSGQTSTRFERLFEMIGERFRMAMATPADQAAVSAESQTDEPVVDENEVTKPPNFEGGADILDEAAEAARADQMEDPGENTRVSGLEPMGDPSGADVLAAAMQEAADAVDAKDGDTSYSGSSGSRLNLGSPDMDEPPVDGEETMSRRRSGWGADEDVL